MSIKYKQLFIILVSVAAPLILTLAMTGYFSLQTRHVVEAQAEQLVDNDLDHVLASTISRLDFHQSAVKQQRLTAVKSYLRSVADNLYRQVDALHRESSNSLLNEEIRRAVLVAKIGTSGYAFGMNSSGTLTIHPKSEGKNLSGSAHIDTMRSQKEGFIIYSSVTTKRDKAVYYRYFAPLDLIIAPGVFVDELENLYDKEGEQKSWAGLVASMETIAIGKSGYFWAIDAGQRKGEYLISPNGNKTGRNGWDLRDANGVAYIQDLVESGKAAQGEEVEKQYTFKNTKTGTLETMMIQTRYYEPLDCILGLSVPFSQIHAASSLINASFSRQMLYTAVTAIVLMILGALFALWSARRTVEPIKQVMTMAREIEMGRLGRRLNLNRKDELGDMARCIDELTDHLEKEIVDSLNRLADGDLSHSVEPCDDQDQIRIALQKLCLDLSQIVGQIQTAGDQIDSASGQVADSSQTLSQGATETAAALEEISSSMNEMASQTKQSAENANHASQLASDASNAATRGGQQMDGMVAAMAEINEAGQHISKIIKVIDEIAFQTNLLALNAAVEAARAGQHGKGFAVVAEEVRNLAARSARAASETSELIEGSVAKTQNGTQIAERTSLALQEIVGSITSVSDLVAEIATASNQQAQAISQVNQGLGQVDQAVQGSTATAEESAAAAEELSSQAEQLKHMLSRFTLSRSDRVQGSAPAAKNQSAEAERLGWGGLS